ncbi:MAG: RES family NAD+ phosphorylase [Candidatus Limnocylindria bacterium]
MWAEWSHATEGRPATGDEVRWVCRLEVDLTVLDLRDPAARHAVGVTMRQLTGEWSPDRPNRSTLRVADVAAELGVDGMVVPSAASPGGWNLAVLPRAFDRVRLIRRRRQPAPA